jgi:hypothetical protein
MCCRRQAGMTECREVGAPQIALIVEVDARPRARTGRGCCAHRTAVRFDHRLRVRALAAPSDDEIVTYDHIVSQDWLTSDDSVDDLLAGSEQGFESL